ncbi:efflux RND transporter periplasmic adaptor subunit [Brevibacillus borstelensis]|uniref:efflux RND transporter periplasmic adaptor subunit n=1 Tax=Brevibacillus borstelensis TaxID=45462 RepID=UPI0030BDBFC8
MKKWIGLSLVALLLAGCGRLNESVQNLKRLEEEVVIKVKTVNAYTVELQQDGLTQEISGVVAPLKELSLSFARSGKIAQILVQKGSAVKAGQALASLDTSVFQQEVSVAQGEVASASIRRAKTLKGPEQHELETQRLQVEKAQQNAAKAAEEHAQAQLLYANGAIAKDELDRLALADKQAVMALQEQQIRYDELKKGADKLEIEAANAEVQKANVQLTRARQEAADAVLKAPFNGVVASIAQTESEQTGPGSEVIRLVDTSQWLVQLQVESGQIGSWQKGKTVQIKAADGTEAEGIVTFVSPVLDTATGTYPVEVTVRDKAEHWRGGMTVTCVYQVKTSSALFVPVTSVGIAEESYYVMKIEDDTIKKQPVKVGNLYGTYYEVLEGLEQGDQIVSSGLSYVVDGEAVKVADE